MAMVIALIVSFLLILGSVFSLLSAVGINRLPDLYCRMHSASLAACIGSGILLLAVGIHSLDFAIFARSLAGVFFILLTAPISANLLARSSRKIGYKLSHVSVVDEMK